MNHHPWLIVLLMAPSLAGAADQDKPAAKLRSPIGTVLQRGDKGWLTPLLYDPVPSRTGLLTMPGARGILEIQEGDVKFTLAGNLPEFSSTPVLESAVSFKRPAAGLDLEFILDRGRVLIENHKETGGIAVKAGIQGKDLAFELLDKKTVVALELFSRWPAGTPFSTKVVGDPRPVADLIFLVISGKVEIEVNNQKQSLQGPAMYRFNSRGEVEGPLPLKKAPDWVKPSSDQTPKVKSLHAAIERLRRGMADQGVLAALAGAQSSADSATRIVAAFSGVAVDNLVPATAALTRDKAPTVRAAGVHALVHYIGRGHAEDVRLYETLLAGKMKPGQAAIVMELLHGFGDEARTRPETYETLITYLQSDQLAIRELAAWNLQRLVPRGHDIVFDAADSAERRALAQSQWKKLVPTR